MRAREFLFENQIATDPLSSLKQVVIGKIQVLPADEKTKKSLEEIEDLLSHVQAGGKMGYINNSLEEINDPDVNKARKILTKYIASIPMSQQERNDMFSKWKKDELVNKELLLQPGKNTFKDLIYGYGTHKGITELVDDLSQVAVLGQGKGEFLLSVLSKSITKLQKGDLFIDGKQIEVKTRDVGGGRFYDQEVRPSSGFQQSVENFRNTWREEINFAFPKLAKTGLKLIDLIDLSDHVDPQRKKDYFASVNAVLENIFPGIDVSGIMDGVVNDNIGIAKQAYAIANLNYYTSKKSDDGLLFINLASKPMSFVFFTDANELAIGGLRLHAGTVYPVTDDPRNAYPQMRIVTTKGGAGPEETSSAISPKQKQTTIKSTKKTAQKPIQQPIQQTQPISQPAVQQPVQQNVPQGTI